eukprot:CAMPEP_0196683194 /NCGR_PEP_ID=MMETSP1090-20130531/9728_1 /TAXON_ID=37098 /ORGANISM="Isochrysis sp, Strain CCMP1244" /LENGTH=48 /DNA_ID= /DNA_START= /DNA_END= /DNA_ORIENTATION=
MTRHGPAMDEGGRFFRNLARTTPLLPCALQTLPQMTRNLLPLISRLAL